MGDSEINQTAMAIGGRRVFGTVHGRHWDGLAKGLGVDAARLRDEVRWQSEAIPLAFEVLLGQADAAELSDRLMPRLQQLCAATVTQLRD